MDLMDKFYSQATLVEAEMASVVPRGKQPEEVYGLIWEFLDRGGKRFRPLLCLSAARAVRPNDEKGAVSEALGAAAAIELFHNFTLIHDDIEDESQMRRGKPCLHVQHGLPLAINAGDGLFMMALTAIGRISPKKREEASGWLLSAFTSVLEGQAIELSWHRSGKFDITEADYERMVGGKTAALVEASTKVGAFLGGGNAREIEALALFGQKIGVAFQIQDDVLNLIGKEKDYQKEIGGDIREGKRTLISISSLSLLKKADAERLRTILAKPQTSKPDIEWAIGKMQDCGAVDYAKKRASGLVDSALSGLSPLPPSGAKDELEQIARYIISRKR
jgi:geranylgeranyl pyrophosphate synthase